MHLAGIHSTMVTTRRIRSHCLFSGDKNATPLIFIHGNLSAATYFEELMLGMPAEYWCIAPDLRGYGDTEDLAIDASRGVGDLSDDLKSLFETLGIPSAHLAGWSAGAGVIMQFALDYPAMVNSLTLIAPVSPYGFGGTCDIAGTPGNKDFAGSGAGTVNTEVVEQMQLGNNGSTSAVAPRQLLRSFFVHAGSRLEREDVLVDATLKQKLGDRRYPGDYIQSQYWPHIAPGKWGPINAMSPKYFNTSGITELANKPPVLWVRGDSDVVISDNSLFDLAAISPVDAQAVDASNGLSPVNPQPMIGQMFEVLQRYEKNGGLVRKVVMKDTGHTPFMEKRELFLNEFTGFLSHCSASIQDLKR